MRKINDLSVNIGKLKLKNPVTVASGTFGYAQEFAGFVDIKKLGAIFTKTITLKARAGNLVPRTCETPAGMLNSIGLENPGVDIFIAEKLTALKKIGVPVIVSIASEGGSGEFIELARVLGGIKEISGIELNISCPNIRRQKTEDRSQKKENRKQENAALEMRPLISQDVKATYDLVKAVRKVTKKTLITKLSPNVTCISEIALAAEAAGSDAVSLINTINGMSIDIEKRQTRLACGSGGLSGPAIRPIAVRMVREVYEKIKIPIIGMGGIMDASSALEFIIAGATAVSIGTANFVNPGASIEIIGGLQDYLKKNRINDIKGLIGTLKR